MTEVQIMESVDYGDTNLNHIIEGDRRYNNDEDYGIPGSGIFSPLMIASTILMVI